MTDKTAVRNLGVSIPLSDLRGAVARAWCTLENASKTMDPVLAEAIVREVQLTLYGNT